MTTLSDEPDPTEWQSAVEVSPEAIKQMSLVPPLSNCPKHGDIEIFMMSVIDHGVVHNYQFCVRCAGEYLEAAFPVTRVKS